MCGIAGFVGQGDRDDLDAMLNALVHRGPDGRASTVDDTERVHLGHTRLAIVDLAGGRALDDDLLAAPGAARGPHFAFLSIPLRIQCPMEMDRWRGSGARGEESGEAVKSLVDTGAN